VRVTLEAVAIWVWSLWRDLHPQPFRVWLRVSEPGMLKSEGEQQAPVWGEITCLLCQALW
jgi:hypothetical protein